MHFDEYRRKSAKMTEIKAETRRLAYLGAVDKVWTALANEYGTDRTLPSKAFIAQCIADRKAGKAYRRRAA